MPDCEVNHDHSNLHAVFGQSDTVKVLFDKIAMLGIDSSESSSEDREGRSEDSDSGNSSTCVENDSQVKPTEPVLEMAGG